jgi:hypothetical protein
MKPATLAARHQRMLALASWMNAAVFFPDAKTAGFVSCTRHTFQKYNSTIGFISDLPSAPLIIDQIASPEV